MADQRGPSRSRESEPLKTALANVALVATLFAFVTVAARALAVARLDTTTAAALVRTSGPVDVFMGTLTQVFPDLLMLAFVMFVFLDWHLAAKSPLPRRLVYGVAWGVGLVALFIAPWKQFLLWICVAVPGVHPASASHLRELLAPSFVKTRSIMIGGVVLLVFLLSDAVWLPQERIQLRGAGTVVGYVVEEDGRWISILKEHDRALLFVEDDDVESREVCGDDLRGVLIVGPSAVQLLQDGLGGPPSKPQNPRCD